MFRLRKTHRHLICHDLEIRPFQSSFDLGALRFLPPETRRRKKCFGQGNQRQCDLFHGRLVFSTSWFNGRTNTLPSIDVMQESRKRACLRNMMTAEGRILATSTAERDVKGGDKQDVGTNAPTSGAKGKAARKRRTPAAKEDGQVANALRSVYQRAVDEDIPAEMLDLLKKLD